MKRRPNQFDPSPWRRRTLLGFWLAISSLICARAIQIQGVQISDEIASQKPSSVLRRQGLGSD
jgi:hypothetical protein